MLLTLQKFCNLSLLSISTSLTVFLQSSYNLQSSSFSLSGVSLSSPADLLPASLSDSFSVSAKFSRTSANGYVTLNFSSKNDVKGLQSWCHFVFSIFRTLLELETDSVGVSLVLVNGVVQVVLGNNTLIVASSVSPDNDWNHIILTFENTTLTSQMSLNLSLFINSTQEGTAVASLNTFPTTLQSATVGNGYTGLLKDVGIYQPALSTDNLDPTPADFIPQCLCYPDSISTDTSSCIGTTTHDRYDIDMWWFQLSLYVSSSTVIIYGSGLIFTRSRRVNVGMNSEPY